MGLSSAPTQWTVFERLDQKPLDPAQGADPEKKLLALYQEQKINPLQAQLLYNRGLRTPDEMRTFLDARLDNIPDPNNLLDMERAVERIQRAFVAQECIAIFGDFDADGVTSAALLTRALRHLGHPIEKLLLHIPSRLHDPRGLSSGAIDTLYAQGATLIITSDCGTSDVAEVDYAQILGVDIIITDHHHPPAQLPRALALINTWRPDSTYGERYLCGVGTAFKLAQALYRAANREDEVWELLDLVAIGTVGDVVPLLGENHTLVRAGMDCLNATKNPGLQALCSRAKLSPGKIRARDISFVLAPRLNAAGRMGDAKQACNLLTTEDSEEAKDLAEKLDQLNTSRQQQTEALMKLVREQAQFQADKQVILVFGEQENWPEGIIGLVAGKMAEETHRPVFVLSQGTEFSRGSARSQEHFNIIQALQAARPHLFERFGGHAQAAGFTIANENIAELHEHLLNWHGESQTFREPLETEETSVDEAGELNGLNGEVESARTAHKVDLVIARPERINLEMLSKVEELGPFGAGNPDPVFQLNNVLLLQRWTSGNEGRHLRVRLRAQNLTFNGTLLRGGARAETLKENALVHVIFSLEQPWSPAGRETKQEVWLKILDIVPLPQAENVE